MINMKNTKIIKNLFLDLLGKINRNIDDFLHDENEESIHKIRTTSRRIEVLTLFEKNSKK
ncbi:hypothetical protein SAMN04488588_0472 [Geotoga petraea]|uniref:Uncharacterized protein n=2 Tax=Geotoga petraea TaxID=28234 RepID=A0A1G6IT29_9BACT|nr:hypothetical protein SAMN04488588_0472 [Geotoga petraea]